MCPVIRYPAKILDTFRIETEPACSTKCINIGYLTYQFSDHVSFLDIRDVIPIQLTIVVFNLDFIALDMDNSETLKHLLVWSLTSTRSPTSMLSFLMGC